jgi:hypothetical protein
VIRIAAAFFLFLAPPSLSDLMDATAQSGRITGIAESPSERLAPSLLLSPGAPPVLSFRYIEASDRGRYADIGLMADDAGH